MTQNFTTNLIELKARLAQTQIPTTELHVKEALRVRAKS